MENSVLKISEDDTMKQESVDENEAIKPESSELQEEGEDSSSDSNDSRTESEDDDDEEEEEEEENGDESFHPGEEAEDLSSEDASTIDQKVLFGHGQQSSSKGATTAAATATSKFPVLKADPEMTLSDYLRQQNRIISARKADAEDDDDSSSLAESDDSSIKILSSGDELQQVKGQMDAGEIPSSSSGKPGVSYDANVRMARVYKELQFSKPGKKLVSSLLTMSPNHQHMSKTPLSDEAFLDDSKVLQALTDYAANRPQRIIKRKVEAELLEVKTEKRSHKHLTYNKDGHLVTSDGESYDLCDCLDKECAGCNYPCAKCTSSKCSYACRIGRKTFIKSIDVLGSGRIYNPFL